MTVEMGNPEPGNIADQQATHARQPVESTEASAPSNASPSENRNGASNEARSDDHAEAGEELTLELAYEAAPGFESSASECFNRARQIAQSLGHISLSSDHLMLALTMDPNARRLLERLGDVVQLRESAMQRLGRMHSRFSRNVDEESQSPTSDLVDIAKKAREAAAEREQLVAVSDLINAFPKANGGLTYGSGESSSKAVALLETIEQSIVPRVADAIARMETVISDAMQRQQTVQSMLQDLNSRNWEETERRQREFMDEIRRQVREAAEMQIAAALKNLNEKFDVKLAGLLTGLQILERKSESHSQSQRKPPSPKEIPGVG
jgi:Clp amino terminal domain, pathogenicity island component